MEWILLIIIHNINFVSLFHVQLLLRVLNECFKDGYAELVRMRGWKAKAIKEDVKKKGRKKEEKGKTGKKRGLEGKKVKNCGLRK